MRLLVTTLLLFSLNATAGEVTEFKPRPAAVEEGSDTYVGILLSEEDFRKLLQDKIDTNAKVAECDVEFKRNKGSLGLLTGVVIGVGTSIAIVRAVQPSQ
jgi:hypothetical protein